MSGLLIAVVAFVSSHFLLSHPLRQPLVARLGERRFLGLYSLVAGVTLAWAIIAYINAPTEQLWIAPEWARHVTWLLMLIASALLVGSLTSSNPALPMAGGMLDKHPEPAGMIRITRHPMMWAFAIWAGTHIWVSGRLETLILAGGIGVLALVGAHLQDRKKARLLGEKWQSYAAGTSYWPFGAQLAGRSSWRGAWPGWKAVIGGLILFVVLVLLHPVVIGHTTGLMEAL